MSTVKRTLNIPITGENNSIVIFPDELNTIDYNDLIDVLRAELAPLQVWRECALEYYRQGLFAEFENILGEIIESLHDPIVEEVYSKKQNNTERKAEIYNALAASILRSLNSTSTKDISSSIVEDASKKVVELLRKSEVIMPLSEYTWLIKGFYELSVGELKRSEDNFRTVYDRSAKSGKKKFQFGASIGLAAVAFCNENYSLALDYLLKSISLNPNCKAAIRVAVGATCFKLGQYDRAKNAIMRALELEPTNVDALNMLATIEMVEAKSESNISSDQNSAVEYSALALSIQPSDPVAMIQTANFLFSQPRVINYVSKIDDRTLLLPNYIVSEICVNDVVEVGEQLFIILEIFQSEDSCTMRLNESINSEFSFIKIKQCGLISRYVHDALSITSIKELRSEGYYLLGKVYHAQRNIDTAFELYRKSIKENTNMTLAQFEAAKILFSRRDFPPALEIFEAILKKYPDDKDSQGFVFLIQTILDKTIIPFDKLRDVNSRFQFDIDLWLLQAHCRRNDPNEYPSCIKCYQCALELCLSRNHSIDPTLLNNIAVLHHCMGKFSLAKDFIGQAIQALKPLNPQSCYSALRSEEFEGILYKWEDSGFKFQVSESEAGKLLSNRNDCLENFQIGDDIVVNDVIVQVSELGSDYIIIGGPLHFLIVNNQPIKVLTKTFLISPASEFPTVIYNYGRILEDSGSITAAIELYSWLVSVHPTYIDCYLRLSYCYSCIGKYEESRKLLAKGRKLDENNVSISAAIGDFFLKNRVFDEAKKNYESIIMKDNKDFRAMVSLGNLYFMSSGTKYSAFSKDSHKYYHTALLQDKRNVHAAVGLGMVCAEKGKYDAAKEIFSRAREADNNAFCNISNVAIVQYYQKKFSDAETLFNASLKQSNKTGIPVEISVDIFESLCKCSMLNERFDDATKYQLRAIHLNPQSLLLWFNFAVIISLKTHGIFKKQSAIKSELLENIVELEQAVEIFNVCFQNHTELSVHVSRELLKANLASSRESLRKMIEVSQRLEKKASTTDINTVTDGANGKRKFEEINE